MLTNEEHSRILKWDASHLQVCGTRTNNTWIMSCSGSEYREVKYDVQSSS
jgi:hypothetical protein